MCDISLCDIQIDYILHKYIQIELIEPKSVAQQAAAIVHNRSSYFHSPKLS